MIAFPNCKINLGLSIINKRNDGYHNLETVFFPLPVTDILEIIPGPRNQSGLTGQSSNQIKFSTTGLKVDGESSDNLCLKAYRLLQKDFPQLPPISMHLHKAIPMGAGLGGGSADGALVLKMLNTSFTLNLSPDELIHYAALLGSDCPFFIINEPCFASGRGEIMETLSLDLSAYTFVMVNAGISVNTGWAFSQLNLIDEPRPTSRPNFKDVIRYPVRDWKKALVNDFEAPVFKKYPEIESIKKALYEHGAVYASMTGSGSTVYGIFEKDAIPEFNFPKNYWVMDVVG